MKRWLVLLVAVLLFVSGMPMPVQAKGLSRAFYEGRVFFNGLQASKGTWITVHDPQDNLLSAYRVTGRRGEYRITVKNASLGTRLSFKVNGVLAVTENPIYFLPGDNQRVHLTAPWDSPRMASGVFGNELWLAAGNYEDSVWFSVKGARTGGELFFKYVTVPDIYIFSLDLNQPLFALWGKPDGFQFKKGFVYDVTLWRGNIGPTQPIACTSFLVP